MNGFKLIFSLCLLGSGCRELGFWSQRWDQAFFSSWGITLFGTPPKVSLSRLRWDFGGLLGRVVVVEGKIIQKDDFETYAVLADGENRLLVVLTHCSSELSELNLESSYRFLGFLHNGEKGLPFLQAKAFYPLAHS